MLGLAPAGVLSRGIVTDWFLPWDAITGVRRVTRHGTAQLVLDARHDDGVRHTRGAYGALERSVAGTDLTIEPAVLSIDIDQLERLLSRLMAVPEARASLGRALPGSIL